LPTYAAGAAPGNPRPDPSDALSDAPFASSISIIVRSSSSSLSLAPIWSAGGM
jgi:hypothetical protein